MHIILRRAIMRIAARLARYAGDTDTGLAYSRTDTTDAPKPAPLGVEGHSVGRGCRAVHSAATDTQPTTEKE